MKNNLIQNKSFEFSVEIIKLYKKLVNKEKEYVLSKQVLRSGTSIGANIEEGIGGQSKRDFIAKFQISLKEARETHYWLRLIVAGEYMSNNEISKLMIECKQIINILTAILITAKKQN